MSSALGTASLTTTATATAIPNTLTRAQVNILDGVERSMSIVSILGCIFMITTFLICEDIRRKAFNRLLFLASFGNIFSNVATLISTSGVSAGDHSAICKMQATLIQW